MTLFIYPLDTIFCIFSKPYILAVYHEPSDYQDVGVKITEVEHCAKGDPQRIKSILKDEYGIEI